MPVRRVVLCCEARLKYEDAQVRVRRGKTARDEAACGATYRTFLSVRKREQAGGGWRTARDDNVVFFVDGGVSQHRTLLSQSLPTGKMSNGLSRVGGAYSARKRFLW
jgi:ribosome modulation factor